MSQKEDFKNISQITAILIFLCYIGISSIQAKPAAPLVLDEWVELALQKLETDGVTGGIHSSSGPFTRSQVAQIIAKAQSRITVGRVKPNPIDIQLLEKLTQEFSDELSEIREEAVNRGLRFVTNPQFRHFPKYQHKISPACQAAIGYSLGKNFFLYEEFEVSEIGDKYPQEGKTASKRLNPWRANYVADFTRVYLGFSVSTFDVQIGRDKIFWGPGYRGALGISDNSPPFDLILLRGDFGPVRGYSFAAVLDKMWSEKHKYLANRYLSGHRLDWQVNDRLELGLSEIILYGGDARDIEWQYVNPILPYYASQYNSKLDDSTLFDNNTMFVSDFAFKPVDGVRIYGEALIDDFQYENHDPNAIGLLAGFYLSNLKKYPNLGIRAEYVRINRWAYTHLVTENQYTHFGSIIGHWLGTDADDLYLELNHFLNVNAYIRLSYEFQRKGEATVEDRYRGEDYKGIKFPSGVVENRHKFGVQVTYEPISGWRLDTSYKYSLLRNEGNIVDNDGNHGEFRIAVKYRFSIMTK
ncbi:MAG: capsule assembly Wzi family protein [Candidatus Poribacteria bacterium]